MNCDEPILKKRGFYFPKMETGGRLGRSSTRYGAPPPPFNGPVKKWKKKWVDIPNPNSNNNNSHSNGGNSGNNTSHLVLYKWTPISSSSNSNSSAGNPSTPAGSSGSAKQKESERSSLEEEPPRRKFRYVPVRFCLAKISSSEALKVGIFNLSNKSEVKNT